jgi:pyridoxamine 5'-phosphate oxidase
MMFFERIIEWIEKEKSLGSENPDCIVLATAAKNSIPHSRIVAIREINEYGILFFTQQGTRKTIEIEENPIASMTLWLPLQQREVVLEGNVITLTNSENENYWEKLPKDRQLKFASYAPTSGQAIESISMLEEKYHHLKQKYKDSQVPITNYCGYRLVPSVICFYTLGIKSFSNIERYTLKDNDWYKELLSP